MKVSGVMDSQTREVLQRLLSQPQSSYGTGKKVAKVRWSDEEETADAPPRVEESDADESESAQVRAVVSRREDARAAEFRDRVRDLEAAVDELRSELRQLDRGPDRVRAQLSVGVLLCLAGLCVVALQAIVQRSSLERYLWEVVSAFGAIAAVVVGLLLVLTLPRPPSPLL